MKIRVPNLFDLAAGALVLTGACLLVQGVVSNANSTPFRDYNFTALFDHYRSSMNSLGITEGCSRNLVISKLGVPRRSSLFLPNFQVSDNLTRFDRYEIPESKTASLHLGYDSNDKLKDWILCRNWSVAPDDIIEGDYHPPADGKSVVKVKPEEIDKLARNKNLNVAMLIKQWGNPDVISEMKKYHSCGDTRSSNYSWRMDQLGQNYVLAKVVCFSDEDQRKKPLYGLSKEFVRIGTRSDL